ncbi:XRE family transcriptional regulator [Deltaproteobacteria bacterium Smac51]|nr:XRE family transcriptional regulator [Deltaproteobacteria bacterium Smac51]
MKSIHSVEYQAFLAALKKARNDKNLKQEIVAQRLKRPQSFVSKYESGERRLDVVEFLAVAKVLEVDPMQLLADAGLLSI